jgi:N-acetylglucosaminyldiphosphoundecaprenol N-acetyl-beta-D-mannosaminyltransferase
MKEMIKYMDKKVKVLDIDFHSIQKMQLLKELKTRIMDGTKTFLVTANPEIVMYADQDEEYKRIVKSADFIIADGIGVIIGSRIIGQPLPERIPGFELMQDLLKKGNEEKWSAYFLGAKNEVVKKAVENIQKQYPDLRIAGYHDGYFDAESPEIPNEIMQAKADLVFVALGFPRQEKFIAEKLVHLEKGLLVGVGGSFDVLAGAVKRAPVIWQKLNLEWFYRLIKQPSRWRRMLVLPLFILRMVKERFKR